MATVDKEVAAIYVQQKDVKPKTPAEEIIDLLIDKIKVVDEFRYGALQFYREIIIYILYNYYDIYKDKDAITNYIKYINKIEKLNTLQQIKGVKTQFSINTKEANERVKELLIGKARKEGFEYTPDIIADLFSVTINNNNFRVQKHFIIYFLKLLPYIILLNDYKSYENKKRELAEEIINFENKLTFPPHKLTDYKEYDIVKNFKANVLTYLKLNNLLYGLEYFVVNKFYHEKIKIEEGTDAYKVWGNYIDCKDKNNNGINYAKVFYITIYLKIYLSLFLSNRDDIKVKKEELQESYNANLLSITKYNKVIDIIPLTEENKNIYKVNISKELDVFFKEYEDKRKQKNDYIDEQIAALKSTTIFSSLQSISKDVKEGDVKREDVKEEDVRTFNEIISNIIGAYKELSNIDTATEPPLNEEIQKILSNIQALFTNNTLLSFYTEEQDEINKIIQAGIQEYNRQQDDGNKIRVFIKIIENIEITNNHKRFNAYIMGLPDEPLWEPGDFLVHFAGIYKPEKMQQLIESIQEGNIPRLNMYS